MQYATSASKTVALVGGLWAREQRVVSTAVDDRAAQTHPTPPDQRYRFLLRNLDDIARVLRSGDASTRLFVATLVGIWPFTTSGAKLIVPNWVNEHHVPPEQTAAFVGELNQELRRFAHSHGATVVDAARVFDALDRSRLQWDFAHMTRDGYELLAWTMFDALRESGVVAGRDDARFRALVETYRAK